jgi:putative DNA primase/helicase
MTLEAVLSKLRHVHRDGMGWKALCPAHPDKKPSLSIGRNNDRILLHCHAGCSTGAVLTALGMEVGDLFEGASQERRIVAEYDYCDENGQLQFQVVRFQPKDFRQRRPLGNGRWAWNLRGIHRVPYRLPELIANRCALICEGEKDCETARGLGLVATCNPLGAGKWSPEYAHWFQDKRITVIADADEPGRKHAEEVAASIFGKAASLKVIKLPQAKDLTDWVERGGTRQSLLELMRTTDQWKPSLQSTCGFTLSHLGELLSRPDVPVEYVVEGLLVAGTVSCVVAKPKVGKSTFVRNLCLAVARGQNFIGLKTKQGECIYLALEEREEDTKNDFRAMGADGTEQIYVHAAAAPAEGIHALCDLVRERRPVLVVIDPLFRIARIRDEKAYGETYAALGPLIDVAREAGTHVMLTHHAGKSAKADAIDAPLGSTAIGGAVCTLVVLRRTESARTIQSVQRIGQDIPETVLQFDVVSRSLSLGEEKAAADLQAIEETILEFLRGTDEPKTETEIDGAVEGKTGQKRKALRALVTQGRISREGVGRKGDPYRYRFSFPCSPYIPGTREQEMEKRPDTRINTGDILVPDSSPEPVLVPQEQLEEGEL